MTGWPESATGGSVGKLARQGSSLRVCVRGEKVRKLIKKQVTKSIPPPVYSDRVIGVVRGGKWFHWDRSRV